MTDTTSKPGDTLEDNVRYLLSRCPWTVQDMSGERTSSRAKEDLAGSLAITFLGMEQTIRDFAEAITEVETASTALEGRKAWARVDNLLKRCRTRGVAGAFCNRCGRERIEGQCSADKGTGAAENCPFGVTVGAPQLEPHPCRWLNGKCIDCGRSYGAPRGVPGTEAKGERDGKDA